MKANTPRIGYVLSSGGARGVYAHTGFLLALEQLGVSIAAAAGCSAGAIVGGIIASGTDVKDWAASLAAVTRKQFWTPDSLWRFLWNMTVRRGRGYTGLSGTDAGLAFCRQNLTAQTFESCRYPFYTVAVSLARSEKIVFSTGEMAPCMVASAAMPILYRPVKIHGDLFCDGALIDLAPMDAICCKQSLDVVIVHHVSRRFPTDIAGLDETVNKPWTMIELLNRMLYHQRPWYLADDPISFQRCPCGCGAAIVVIEPKLPPLKWPLTEGGPAIQEADIEQVEMLLRPHLEALLTDPGKKLPLPVIENSGLGKPDSPSCDTE